MANLCTRRGFVVEFDEKTLDEIMNREYDRYCYAHLYSDDVKYDNHDQHVDLTIYNGVAGEMFRKLFDRHDLTDVIPDHNLDAAIVRFVGAAPFLKHKSFSEENEYRIVGTCARPKFIPAGEKREPKSIMTRPRGSMIIPYIELFDTTRPLPIRSIIVGPHPYQEKQADAVKLMLDATSFTDVEVRLSEIPFRE
jgi:hypothetical protein